MLSRLVQSSLPWPPLPPLSSPGSTPLRSPPLSSPGSAALWSPPLSSPDSGVVRSPPWSSPGSATLGAWSERRPPLSSPGSVPVRRPPLSSPGSTEREPLPTKFSAGAATVPPLSSPGSGLVRRPPLSSPGSAGLDAFLAADAFLSSAWVSSLDFAADLGVALAELTAGAAVLVAESSATRTFLASSLGPVPVLLSDWVVAKAALPVRRTPATDNARAALVFMAPH
ncbi:hypothetical protein DBZ45_20235 [Arthrobacter globiformis]|uniref:Uncharacterized protein n=1 Tax=Arthrobacter globiformis TaxID=1665 RepID=A0A328HBJ4_ARTGO|nr:hypothetical protein DBZ45_20235 [Arthrobacter globiformis]